MSQAILAFLTDTASASGATLLLDAAIKGVAVLLAATLVVLAMRRASAAMRHLVWTAGLVCLLVMPFISLVVPRWEALPDWLRAESIVGVRNIDSATEGDAARTAAPPSAPPAGVHPVNTASLLQGDGPVAVSNPPAAQTGPDSRAARHADEAHQASVLNWLGVAAWIWAIVAAVLLLRIVLSRYVLGRVIRTASPVRDGAIASQLAAARRRYDIRHAVYAHLSGNRDLPMTWGIFRTRILLPSEAALWPAGRLDAVLLHELAHVKRRDTLTHVLGQVACAVYWLNPLVWLAAWRIHVERERACDDLVVGSGIKSSDYAEHLLSIVGNYRGRRTVPCSAVAMAKPSRLEGRLLAILNERLNRRAATKGLFAIVLVAAIVGVTTVAMLRAQRPEDGPEDALLGIVIDLVVSDDTGETPLVDFDRGVVGAVPAELKARRDEAAVLAWMAQNGFDAVGDTGRNSRGLIGFDMIARYRGDGEWNMPLAHVQARLAAGKPGSPTTMPAQVVPATYFIRTREGGVGILQIVGFDDRPKGVRIRFKMLGGANSSEPPPDATLQFLPVDAADGKSPGHLQQAAREDAKAHATVDVIGAFFRDALAGNMEEALRHSSEQVPPDELMELMKYGAEVPELAKVYASADHALVITKLLQFSADVDDPACLSVRLQKREKWLVTDIGFETPESIPGEVERFLVASPDARLVWVPSDGKQRNYVRLVVGLDGAMTFEGRPTTWDALPQELEAIAGRAATVLEVAISTEELTVAQLNEIQSRTGILANRHGFEYASFVGLQALGSKGTQESSRNVGDATSGPVSTGQAQNEELTGHSSASPDGQDANIELPAQVHAFLQAALAGNLDETAKYVVPAFPLAQVEDFSELGIKTLGVERMYVDAEWALAITKKVVVKNPPGNEEGRLMITLQKRERWLVRDVDFEDNASLEREVGRFRTEHPAAKELAVAGTGGLPHAPTADGDVPLKRRLLAAGLTDEECQAILILLVQGKLPRFPGLAERVLPPSSPDEPFESVAALAGLTEAETTALDRLLRAVPLDDIDALVFDESLPMDDLLEQATVKLRVLLARQNWVIEEIDALLQSGKLDETSRRALTRLDAAVKRHHVANVLTIRQVFQPDPATENRANWTALSKRQLEAGEPYFMAMARAPIGGEFPVRFEGEEKERFRVRVVSGDDEALTVIVFFQMDDVTIEPAQEEFRLVRDQPVELEVNGDRYTLLYPSTHVARSGSATTDLAQLIVSYRADRVEAKTDAPSEENIGEQNASE